MSLDTARAEVLQRSREDRVMKLIKLQITATETHCGMFGTAGQLRDAPIGAEQKGLK